MAPIVAFLSDFGTQDHYAGAMKGALLCVCPEARIVDVVHDLPPHDVGAGAFALAAACPAFPAGTVFLAVVDPGVGSSRRALALEAGGWRFVGPDNGLFTLVLEEHPDARIHEITASNLFPGEVSATFHGRDVFAPVAGQLARGLALSEVGPAVEAPVRFPVPHVVARGDDEWEAEVLQVDRFGNLVTSVTVGDLDAIVGRFGGDPTEVVVVVEGTIMPMARTYSDVPEGEACALVGSARRLEIAVHGGSAARLLGAARGASIRIRAAARSDY
jgi:S-adenosylmethionine hydrolase